jgi:4'-phosphopantetheinyl transferase
VWRLATREPIRADPEMLDTEELSRWRRLATPVLRTRFLGAHTGLRTILGGYLGIAPENVSFVRAACASCGGAHGKPRLSPAHRTALTFSLARARDVAVVAVAAVNDVGVDAEWVDLTMDVEPLARSAGTAGERARLLGLPVEARSAAFFSWWTRKEAYAKMRGEGLPSFETFQVSVPPERPRLVQPTPGAQIDAWLSDFAPAAGYAGAVALNAPIARVSQFEFRET